MQDYKLEVVKLIKDAFPEFIESSISIPPESSLGDFAIPCFPYSKQFGNPQEAAKEISKLLSNLRSDSLITEVRLMGPYVNLFLNKSNVIKEVLEEVNKNNFCKEKPNNKTIVIDYSAPNVAKNMGLHNLRSTVIGQAIYNVYKHLGYNIIGVNHLGDWGTQFGKLIWALEQWSSFEELKEKGILFLNEMYVRFHDHVNRDDQKHIEEEAKMWFKRIEDGDPIAKKWWELFVEISMKDYNKIYERLNVSFDKVTGESFYIQFLEETLTKLKKKNLLEESEGALVVEVGEDMPPCLLKKSDGATLYGTRDIAAAMYRLKEFNPEKVLYIVDIAQELHFNQVFKVMEKFDPSTKDKFEHVMFGRLSFKDGSMSTRKGNIVPLREVLDKSKNKVLQVIAEKNPDLENKEEVAEMIGTGAIVFGDLIHDRVHNIIFEWDKILDFQGETGPYIQYTHARIKSILRKSSSTSLDEKELTQDLEYDLVKKLYNFKEVLEKVVKQNKPSILARYVIELSQLFNSYYVKVPVLNEKESNSRLFLLEQIAKVIESSMKLLGIQVPEKM